MYVSSKIDFIYKKGFTPFLILKRQNKFKDKINFIS